jgi:hypothetical protein
MDATLLLPDSYEMPRVGFGYLLVALRFLTTLSIIEHGGVPLHASAAGRNGKAIAFAARSGGGKSTMVDLLQPAWQCINDEYSAILPEGRSCTVMGTPFVKWRPHTTVTDDRAPLATICALTRDTRVTIRPMGLRDRVQLLLGNAFATPLPNRHARTLVENCFTIASTVSAYTVGFTPSRPEEVADALEKTFCDESYHALQS